MEIITESGKWIKCTKGHILYDKGGKIDASKLTLKSYIKTIDGYEKISIINKLESSIVYDIIGTKSGNTLTNGIISHNCDEFAHVPKNIAEEFWISNLPAISSFKKSKIVIISTPKGKYNLFYDLFIDARTVEEKKQWIDALDSEDKHYIDTVKNAQGKKNSFICAKFNWRVIPDKDEKWAVQEKTNIGETRFAQEYECVHGDTEVYIKYHTNKWKIKDLYNLGIFNSYILGPSGFKRYYNIIKYRKPCLRFICEHNINIIVSFNHHFIVENCVIKAHELNIGDYLEHKLYKKIQILNIDDVGINDVYDIIGVEDSRSFYR